MKRITNRKPPATQLARSRWFGELLPFQEIGNLETKDEQIAEMIRHVDEIERQERAKPHPCGQLLANAAALRERLRRATEEANAVAPSPPKRPA